MAENTKAVYKAVPPSMGYDWTVIPWHVLKEWHNEAGQRCTEYVCMCESANAGEFAPLLASLLNGLS